MLKKTMIQRHFEAKVNGNYRKCATKIHRLAIYTAHVYTAFTYLESGYLVVEWQPVKTRTRQRVPRRLISVDTVCYGLSVSTEDF